MIRPNFLPNQPVTVHADPAILDEITLTTAEWCPVCDGEKFSYHEVPGGVYNSWLGGWEPDETREPCERCDATGMVTRTRCAACGELHPSDEWGITATDRECSCTDADLLRFHYLALEAQRVAESGMPTRSQAPVEWNTVHYLAARAGAPVTYERAGRLTWAIAKLERSTIRSPSSYEEEAHGGAVTQAA